MTNPNNAVGTNAAYGGRTSVNAFNDDLTIYSRGILSGWACSPNSGMTVQIGGNGADRDAAVAEDNAGNKTSINNISGSPIDVTIPAAPATNNRIDLIVAYADNPPTGTSTVVDNPAACGIIVVSGTAAASPTEPTNAAIRSAITTDGATGSTAYYVILAKIRVGTGVTTIGSGVITQGDTVTSYAIPASNTVTTDAIADGAITSDKVDWTTLDGTETGWVYLGETYTTTASTYVDFTFPTTYANYKVVVSGQASGSTPSDSWVDVRARSGSSDIASDMLGLNVSGQGAVNGGYQDGGTYVANGTLAAYDSFTFELESFNTRSTNWRQWNSRFYRSGNRQLRMQVARATSATTATGIRLIMGGAYIADCVIKVWGSNN